MASRGTNPSELDKEENREYSTSGYVQDAEILVGKGHNHSLPEVPHNPYAKYLKLNPDGSFKELRIFEDGKLMYEIDFHVEPSLSGNHVPILHIHDILGKEYKNHPQSRRLTKEEFETYKDYFVGLDLERIQK